MSYVPFVAGVTFLLFIQALLGRTSILVPDLGPLLAVYLGLFARRERLSVALALLALLRAAAGLEPVGALIILYLCIGHAVLLFRDVLYPERLATQWVAAFFGGAVYVVLRTVAGLFLPLGGEVGAGGVLRVTVATLAATLLAPGVFALFRMLRVGP